MFLTIDEVSVFEKIQDAFVVIWFTVHDLSCADVIGHDVDDTIEKFLQSHVHPRVGGRPPSRGVISDPDPVSVFLFPERHAISDEVHYFKEKTHSFFKLHET